MIVNNKLKSFNPHIRNIENIKILNNESELNNTRNIKINIYYNELVLNMQFLYSPLFDYRTISNEIAFYKDDKVIYGIIFSTKKLPKITKSQYPFYIKLLSDFKFSAYCDVNKQNFIIPDYYMDRMDGMYIPEIYMPEWLYKKDNSYIPISEYECLKLDTDYKMTYH